MRFNSTNEKELCETSYVHNVSRAELTVKLKVTGFQHPRSKLSLFKFHLIPREYNVL